MFRKIVVETEFKMCENYAIFIGFSHNKIAEKQIITKSPHLQTLRPRPPERLVCARYPEMGIPAIGTLPR
jgi:hypothetical protein